MEDIFYSIDGDNVGKKLESLIIQCNEPAVTHFSETIRQAISEAKKHFVDQSATIILAGGDSLICKSKTEITGIDLIRNSFLQATGCTLSVGIGNTMIDSMLSLKISKFSKSIERR